MAKDYLKAMTPGGTTPSKPFFAKSSITNPMKKKKKKVTDYMDMVKPGKMGKTKGC